MNSKLSSSAQFRRKELFSVFVGHIHLDVTKEELGDLFSGCGQIADYTIINAKEGHTYTYGFVRYKTREEALRAIKELNGWRLKSQEIVVAASNDTVVKLRSGQQHGEAEYDIPATFDPLVADVQVKRSGCVDSIINLNRVKETCLWVNSDLAATECRGSIIHDLDSKGGASTKPAIPIKVSERCHMDVGRVTDRLNLREKSTPDSASPVMSEFMTKYVDIRTTVLELLKCEKQTRGLANHKKKVDTIMKNFGIQTEESPPKMGTKTALEICASSVSSSVTVDTSSTDQIASGSEAENRLQRLKQLQAFSRNRNSQSNVNFTSPKKQMQQTLSQIDSSSSTCKKGDLENKHCSAASSVETSTLPTGHASQHSSPEKHLVLCSTQVPGQTFNSSPQTCPLLFSPIVKERYSFSKKSPVRSLFTNSSSCVQPSSSSASVPKDCSPPSKPHQYSTPTRQQETLFSLGNFKPSSCSELPQPRVDINARSCSSSAAYVSQKTVENNNKEQHIQKSSRNSSGREIPEPNTKAASEGTNNHSNINQDESSVNESSDCRLSGSLLEMGRKRRMKDSERPKRRNEEDGIKSTQKATTGLASPENHTDETNAQIQNRKSSEMIRKEREERWKNREKELMVAEQDWNDAKHSGKQNRKEFASDLFCKVLGFASDEKVSTSLTKTETTKRSVKDSACKSSMFNKPQHGSHSTSNSQHQKKGSFSSMCSNGDQVPQEENDDLVHMRVFCAKSASPTKAPGYKPAPQATGTGLHSTRLALLMNRTKPQTPGCGFRFPSPGLQHSAVNKQCTSEGSVSLSSSQSSLSSTSMS